MLNRNQMVVKTDQLLTFSAKNINKRLQCIYFFINDRFYIFQWNSALWTANGGQPPQNNVALKQLIAV